MIKFKHKEDEMLFAKLHPILIMIFADMYNYAYEKHNILLTVTQTISTKEQDLKLGRKSSSHREKRAIDIRTRDLDGKIIDDLISYVNNKWAYKNYHYSSTSGQKRLAYWHVGTAGHIHLAIHSRYKL